MARYPAAAKYSPHKAFNACQLVNFTVGAKVSNVINVALQLKDALANLVAQPVAVMAWLTSDALGLTLSTTAPTSTTAIGTNGTLLAINGTYQLDLLTNASGQVDINITQTASPVAYYLAVQMPDGSTVVSPIIQF